MTGTEALVLAVLLGMAVALASRRVSPTVGVVGALLVLFLTGVTDADEAFHGLSNSAPLTVASLYVVAGGVQRTGALASVVRKTAGERGISRVLLGSAAVSTFVANTPVVAVLIDPVIRWARERGHSPSRYLIPLSYATILGGMATVIGTSTNLVGSGVLEDLGAEPLTFFEPAKFGLPVGLLGLLITVVLGPRLLPSRGGPNDAEVAADGGFLVACTVVEDGPLDGCSIEDADLRNLAGMFLVAVTHGESGEVVAPVGPSYVLRGGDLCSFAGAVDDVVELRNREGFRYAESDQLDALDDGRHAWFEAVIGNGSSLIGRTMKEADFRSRYQAAAVGLHRAGRPVTGKLGQERLRLGDALLLVSDLGFAQRWGRRSDFLLIRRRAEPAPSTSRKALLSIAVLLFVVILTVSQVTDVLRASVIGAVLTVVTGIHTPRQARDAVDLNVVVLIAAALGLGGAVSSSGLAARIAHGLTEVFDGFGLWGIALAVVLAALVLTELVTNAGAVAIMVPIATASAAEVSADPRLFALGAIVAASASFLTPIGYQTNTMVYGPGRYRISDYLRVGAPITLMVLVVVPLMMVHGALW